MYKIVSIVRFFVFFPLHVFIHTHTNSLEEMYSTNSSSRFVCVLLRIYSRVFIAFHWILDAGWTIWSSETMEMKNSHLYKVWIEKQDRNKKRRKKKSEWINICTTTSHKIVYAFIKIRTTVRIMGTQSVYTHKIHGLLYILCTWYNHFMILSLFFFFIFVHPYFIFTHISTFAPETRDAEMLYRFCTITKSKWWQDLLSVCVHIRNC